MRWTIVSTLPGRRVTAPVLLLSSFRQPKGMSDFDDGRTDVFSSIRTTGDIYADWDI